MCTHHLGQIGRAAKELTVTKNFVSGTSVASKSPNKGKFTPVFFPLCRTSRTTLSRVSICSSQLSVWNLSASVTDSNYIAFMFMRDGISSVVMFFIALHDNFFFNFFQKNIWELYASPSFFFRPFSTSLRASKSNIYRIVLKFFAPKFLLKRKFKKSFWKNSRAFFFIFLTS